MATNIQEKVLRVGIIHNGKVIEERLLLRREPVSVGASRAATFNVPLQELPQKVEILAIRGGRYHLVCGDGATCRVTAGGTTFEHRANPNAAGRAPALYPLSPDALGRVEVGPVTVLFQFVTPPPALPRVQLPEMARVRWSGRIDRPFAAIVMWIVLVHVGFVMAVQSAPLPITPYSAVWQDEQGHIIEVIIPKEPEKPSDDAVGETVEKPVETKRPEKQPAEGPKSGAATGDKPTAAQTREKVLTTGIFAVLAAKQSGDSAVSKVLGGGDSVNVAQVFDGVSTGVASLEEGLGKGPFTIGGGGPKGPLTIDTPGDGRGPVVNQGTVGEKPKSDLKFAGRLGVIEDETPNVDGCLEKEKVTTVVKIRLRSIQDCYERELKKIPSLAGKLSIGFTINGEGSVIEAHVESDQMGNRAVADCIVSRLRNWHFPKSGCASVSVSYPFIFVKTQ